MKKQQQRKFHVNVCIRKTLEAEISIAMLTFFHARETQKRQKNTKKYVSTRSNAFQYLKSILPTFFITTLSTETLLRFSLSSICDIKYTHMHIHIHTRTHTQTYTHLLMFFDSIYLSNQESRHLSEKISHSLIFFFLLFALEKKNRSFLFPSQFSILIE